MRPFTYLYIYLFMRTNHYLSKLHLGDLISCFVCEQNSFVRQFKCRHFFSRVLHAWITGIRPGRLDASIVGDDWGEFEMIKIILYKLLQSYQLSGSPRFACHKRCLYISSWSPWMIMMMTTITTIVVSGAPNDGFLLNALKTLFSLSRILLDL